jgi:hypothetical protein
MLRRPLVNGIGACLLALLLGCRSDERDFERATRANTIEAYEQFVAKHPSSKHHSSASERLAELQAERDLATAQKADEIGAYDKFLAQHPKSKSAPDGKRRLSELLGQAAYRYKSGFKGATGAHRITVQGTASGSRIKAGPVKFLIRTGGPVEMTPRDARLSFVLGKELEFDAATFGLASFVRLDFKDGVVLPARLVFKSGEQGLQANSISAVFPDAARSSEVSLVVDPAVGSTAYAGLRFGSQGTVAINEDGRVEVDREGVTATDASGSVWASRSLAADGSPPFVIIKR